MLSSASPGPRVPGRVRGAVRGQLRHRAGPRSASRLRSSRRAGNRRDRGHRRHGPDGSSRPLQDLLVRGASRPQGAAPPARGPGHAPPLLPVRAAGRRLRPRARPLAAHGPPIRPGVRRALAGTSRPRRRIAAVPMGRRAGVHQPAGHVGQRRARSARRGRPGDRPGSSRRSRHRHESVRDQGRRHDATGGHRRGSRRARQAVRQRRALAPAQPRGDRARPGVPVDGAEREDAR
jgi:hypothetical protein